MDNTTGDTSQHSPANPMKRRGLLLGAGVAGAAAVALKALPGGAPAAVAEVAAKAAVDTAGGYQVTAHVLRYYETARA